MSSAADGRAFLAGMKRLQDTMGILWHAYLVDPQGNCHEADMAPVTVRERQDSVGITLKQAEAGIYIKPSVSSACMELLGVPATGEHLMLYSRSHNTTLNVATENLTVTHPAAVEMEAVRLDREIAQALAVTALGTASNGTYNIMGAPRGTPYTSEDAAEKIVQALDACGLLASGEAYTISPPARGASTLSLGTETLANIDRAREQMVDQNFTGAAEVARVTGALGMGNKVEGGTSVSETRQIGGAQGRAGVERKER